MEQKRRYREFLGEKSITIAMTSWLFVLLMVLFASNVSAQEELDYSVHANIIYRFTKYVDWPPSKGTENFIIGIIGKTPLYDELKKAVNGKKVGDQTIVLQKFSSSEAAFNCQILFISEAAAGSIKKIIGTTQNNPVLLVSESKGAAQKGSCINFNIVNDKLKLEFNKNSIEQRGLNIASELLQLGTQVK
jgi:hypothetical protein